MVRQTSSPPRAPEEQLKLMALHLRSDRERLLIVTTPDTEAEHALAEEMRLRLEDEVTAEEVTFSSASVEGLSLSQHLSTLPSPSGKAVVFVFGLDDLPPDDRETAINALNWGRERLRWSGYSVVLWVRPETPGTLGNRAPDFFSWRSDVLEFDLPANPAERQQAVARLRLFAPAELHDLRQRYRDYVMRTYQWLDFRGLLQLRNVVRLPLDDVFVPLHATTATDYALPFDHLPTAEATHDIKWQRYASRSVERRIAFNDAVHQHRYVLLLGDPGSGKSTLLRFLALTFAQGQEYVQDKLGLSEDRVPILVPLSAFADALKTQPDLSLTAFLPAYFTGQDLPDFSPLFDDALHSGQAIVLLDGLDEMLTYDDRAMASRAVAEFVSIYPTTRIVVTSRIAGYTPGMLPASFATLTVSPFDDPAIKQFANQWSLAFEAIGLSTFSELPPDVRHRAMQRADNLTIAATSHPGVRRLATNPLLLTVLALIHYQGTRLPNRRADLYRLCVEAFAETWNLARSLTGRPIDLRLGERRLDEEFVVGMLAPIACWLHETKPTGAVEREELETRIAAQFVDSEGATLDEAMSLAHDFVDLAREQLGLLVERAPDVFSFLHLSVQEYLVARFLSERQDSFERLKPRLHHPRWREVVLLTAGCLRGDYATAFIQNILDAHSPFDSFVTRALARRQPPKPSFLRRIIGREGKTEPDITTTMLSILDALLASDCVGDGISVSVTLSQLICNTLFELWKYPPFSALRGDIASAFSHLNGSVVSHHVRDFLVDLMQDSNVDEMVRRHSVAALHQSWAGDSQIKASMLQLLQNSNENPLARTVADALGKGWAGDPEVRATLLRLLQDQHKSALAPNIARALGKGWAGDTEIGDTMLQLLQNASENYRVRCGAALALSEGWAGNLEVKTQLLCFLQNSNENGWVRAAAAVSLGDYSVDDPESRTTLLHILQDSSEDEKVRGATAWALGDYSVDDPESRMTLLHILQDSSEDEKVRSATAAALDPDRAEDPEISETLLRILQDPSEKEALRIQILQELRLTGQNKIETLTTLISLLHDRNQTMSVRESVVQAFGQVGHGETEVMPALLQAATESELRDAALSSAWTLLSHGGDPETYAALPTKDGLLL